MSLAAVSLPFSIGLYSLVVAPCCSSLTTRTPQSTKSGQSLFCFSFYTPPPSPSSSSSPMFQIPILYQLPTAAARLISICARVPPVLLVGRRSIAVIPDFHFISLLFLSFRFLCVSCGIICVFICFVLFQVSFILFECCLCHCFVPPVSQDFPVTRLLFPGAPSPPSPAAAHSSND